MITARARCRNPHLQIVTRYCGVRRRTCVGHWCQAISASACSAEICQFNCITSTIRILSCVESNLGYRVLSSSKIRFQHILRVCPDNLAGIIGYRHPIRDKDKQCPRSVRNGRIRRRPARRTAC